MGETLSSEQNIGMLIFLILYKMVADVKSRRSNFIMYVKESRSVNSSMF